MSPRRSIGRGISFSPIGKSNTQHLTAIKVQRNITLFLNGIFFALLMLSAVYYFCPLSWLSIASAFIFPLSLGWLAKAISKVKSKEIFYSKIKELTKSVKKPTESRLKNKIKKALTIFKIAPRITNFAGIASLTGLIATTIAILFLETPEKSETKGVLTTLEILNTTFQSIIAAYIFALIDIYIPRSERNKKSILEISYNLNCMSEIFNFWTNGSDDIESIEELKDKLESHGLYSNAENKDDFTKPLYYLINESRRIIKTIRDRHKNIAIKDEITETIEKIEKECKKIEEIITGFDNNWSWDCVEEKFEINKANKDDFLNQHTKTIIEKWNKIVIING